MTKKLFLIERFIIQFQFLVYMVEIVPGAGYGGYIPLKVIVAKQKLTVKKISFEFKKGYVLANEKTLQGLRIKKEDVIITGDHYTSWEKATQIRSMMRIEPSLNDPFVYISEPGKMDGWPEKLIKKELGAFSADTKVKLSLIVAIERVWIKASRLVAHYAIKGILTRDQMIKVGIQRHRER